MFQEFAGDYVSQNAYVLGFVAGILLLSVAISAVACRFYAIMSKYPEEQDPEDPTTDQRKAEPRMTDAIVAEFKKGPPQVLRRADVLYHSVATAEDEALLCPKDCECHCISEEDLKTATENLLSSTQAKQAHRRTRRKHRRRHTSLELHSVPGSSIDLTNNGDLEFTVLDGSAFSVDDHAHSFVETKAANHSRSRSSRSFAQNASTIQHHKITKLRDKRFVNIDPLHVKQCEICQWEILHDQEIFL